LQEYEAIVIGDNVKAEVENVLQPWVITLTMICQKRIG
jgi:hypothetical protein